MKALYEIVITVCRIIHICSLAQILNFDLFLWKRPCPFSCVSAEACLTGWPNARGRRDGGS